MKTQRILIHRKVRQKIIGTTQMPRLSVFRSNKHIYAQLIDDLKGVTMATSSDLKLSLPRSKTPNSPKITKIEKAQGVGEIIAKVATAKKIKKVVFDRGGYKYHGQVKALAEGARKGGLIF